ncbi:LacI family DNA-binding transcriptional regulator [Sinomonas sp. ASV322]|uniref:LacI family DNA-binding transcriptional regulator n=1 Tax=Sinomonas sp. ASV322 TaxID=3041920 RepID=UPI0027DCA034|nr:LacI family DNA-binding transcriptional regulator [Sinomonas sp. ASV322]MDQ4502534.1 LacI family DNA-binding transcriptional regulator [Sinomonas sp. ASV322]
MAATLTDVAKLAGVSLATASRAFSDPGRLAAETRQRVLSAAAALGYEAATVSTGARTLGVVVPDVSNAVFAALIKSVQERAWPGRHRMIVADTAESTDREREHLAALASSVDGIILCSPRLPAEEVRELAGRTPLVVINGEAVGAARVLMDAGEGLRQAVEHLFSLGHRRFAYVPGPASSWANGQRLAAVTRLCEEWGVELVTVGNQNATVDGGLAAAASVVASGATAAIAYNDLVAVGLLAGARTLGYHCPEDLSVVGIDDLDIAAAAEPGLTSVRVAIERSGALGLDLLLEQLAGKSRATEAVHLTSQLIVRGSTFAARGADSALRGGQHRGRK